MNPTYFVTQSGTFYTGQQQPGEGQASDDEVLAFLRANVWLSIKGKRDACKLGGVQVGGNWYQSDADSRIQYLGLKDGGRDILAAGGSMTSPITVGGQQILWKTFANTFTPMTVQLAFDLVAAIAALDAAAFKTAETHRAAIAVSNDPLSYDYSTGWPASYQA